MAEPQSDGIRVLQPQQIAASVRKLVEEAQETLLLVSPYFKPWAQMQGEIERAAQRGATVHLIVRGDQLEKIEPLLAPCHGCGVQVFAVEKLHAKIYVNERGAILTSMNLVDASAQESWEAGILVDAVKAAATYDKLRQQAESCVDEGTPIHAPGRRAPKQPRPAATASAPSRPTSGTCIRCSKSIRLDSEKPLCLGCYGKWKKYGNPEYQEKHCHGCGKDVSTSVAKPLCRPCYLAMSA